MNNTTTLTYDATQTYVHEKTNAKGHTATTTYNTGWGKPLTVIPPHLQGTALAITYQYDTFGRLQQENRPDGGYTAYQYQNIGNPTSQYVQKQEHIVSGSSASDHYTASYFDGLGRAYWTTATGPAGTNGIVSNPSGAYIKSSLSVTDFPP